MARPPTPFTFEFYEDERRDAPAYRWILDELSRVKRRALGVAMEEQLAHLGIDVCATRFGRPLGGGLFEFRLDGDVSAILTRSRPPSEPICLRLFCHAFGRRKILILGGYDKGRDPSRKRQTYEISVARDRLNDWHRRMR